VTNQRVKEIEKEKPFLRTCVSVRLSEDENSALSAIDKYCFSRNFFSSATSCCVVNGVRGLRFGLCFRNVHFMGVGSLGPSGDESPIPKTMKLSMGS
jgi:hypothetical protein